MVLSNFTCMTRLSQDPSIYNSEKSTVARFSGAVDRPIKREGEPEADFFNFVGFGKTAEFIEKYLKKGTKIIVQSRPRVDRYKDKEGNDRQSVEFVVEGIQFCEAKKTDSKPAASAAETTDEGLSEEALREAESMFV